ncbi:hypothetical protein GGR35_002207 [Mucilaginibacter phyllosphaerae]|uniref:Uncharacterized protein n=1 Tax=Mucilaginibacter phyllosphaerae TaxID=1812349 RepID=A0ABR6I965_9SPHI|nr:hypothetical protein [Mucilaginibacter phyllosphaerae]MBB3969594.1 hypothetical protein [Mucilaginibacter phyllosphaerae]
MVKNYLYLYLSGLDEYFVYQSKRYTEVCFLDFFQIGLDRKYNTLLFGK